MLCSETVVSYNYVLYFILLILAYICKNLVCFLNLPISSLSQYSYRCQMTFSGFKIYVLFADDIFLIQDLHR